MRVFICTYDRADAMVVCADSLTLKWPWACGGNDPILCPNASIMHQQKQHMQYSFRQKKPYWNSHHCRNHRMRVCYSNNTALLVWVFVLTNSTQHTHTHTFKPKLVHMIKHVEMEIGKFSDYSYASICCSNTYIDTNIKYAYNAMHSRKTKYIVYIYIRIYS